MRKINPTKPMLIAFNCNQSENNSIPIHDTIKLIWFEIQTTILIFPISYSAFKIGLSSLFF